MRKTIRASEISFLTEMGEDYDVPEDGSLSLLAFGYVGLMAWREKRKQAQIKRNEENSNYP